MKLKINKTGKSLKLWSFSVHQHFDVCTRINFFHLKEFPTDTNVSINDLINETMAEAQKFDADS